MRWAFIISAGIVLAGGCAGDAGGPEPAPSAKGREPAAPAPPPDAGTQRGHGADQPGRIAVPRSDASPPGATIVLATPGGRELARATALAGETTGRLVRLRRPALRGTTVGLDRNGGVARVRISVRETIACRSGESGAGFVRLQTRYFPPPQIERIRSNPGAELPTRRVRSRLIELGGRRCGAGADPLEVRGELWGEAINGSGLEAVTAHIRLVAATR